MLRAIRYLIRQLRGDRGWSLAAAFAARISSFATSFILARFGSTAVLGSYTAVVNTSTAVVAPVLFAVSNGATVDARRPHAPAAAVLRAHGLLAGLLGLACGAAFVVMASRLDASEQVTGALAMGAGLVAVMSQLIAGAFQGVLYGTGEFRATAIAAVAVAAAGLAAAIPAVYLEGLRGALLVLIGTSVVLPIVLAPLARGPRVPGELAAAFAHARAQLARSVPSIGATGVAAIASWATTVYLTEHHHGASGVGVLAIGTQWLSLAVLAVTGWGGVTLRALVVARDAGTLGAEVRAQLVRNVAITAVAAAAMLAGADLIAWIYGASGTPVAAVIRIHAATALVLAVNNVAERALFATHRQRAWLGSSLAGALVTLALAIVLVSRGIEFVPIAMLAGYVVTAGISLAALGVA